MKTCMIVFLFALPFYMLGQNVQQNSEKFNKKTSQKVIVRQVKANEKKAEIQQNYPTEEYLKANNVPNDFPRYKDTGNPKIDGARYHDEKQAWIKKNPKAFEKIKHLNL